MIAKLAPQPMPAEELPAADVVDAHLSDAYKADVLGKGQASEITAQIVAAVKERPEIEAVFRTKLAGLTRAITDHDHISRQNKRAIERVLAAL